MDANTRERIFETVCGKVQQLENRHYGSCLYYSHYLATQLFDLGKRVLIQAGSLQWPRILPSQDDGKCSTHFSYMWENIDEKNRVAISRGVLPEMHVWCALPEEQELIDFSTGELPTQCEITTPMKWTRIQPPKFFWGGAKDIPEGVIYDPSYEASLLAMKLLIRMFDPDYIKVLFKQRRLVNG